MGEQYRRQGPFAASKRAAVRSKEWTEPTVSCLIEIPLPNVTHSSKGWASSPLGPALLCHLLRALPSTQHTRRYCSGAKAFKMSWFIERQLHILSVTVIILANLNILPCLNFACLLWCSFYNFLNLVVSVLFLHHNILGTRPCLVWHFGSTLHFVIFGLIHNFHKSTVWRKAVNSTSFETSGFLKRVACSKV